MSITDENIDCIGQINEQVGSSYPWNQPSEVHLSVLIRFWVIYSGSHKWLVLKLTLKMHFGSFIWEKGVKIIVE